MGGIRSTSTNPSTPLAAADVIGSVIQGVTSSSFDLSPGHYWLTGLLNNEYYGAFQTLQQIVPAIFDNVDVSLSHNKSTMSLDGRWNIDTLMSLSNPLNVSLSYSGASNFQGLEMMFTPAYSTILTAPSMPSPSQESAYFTYTQGSADPQDVEFTKVSGTGWDVYGDYNEYVMANYTGQITIVSFIRGLDAGHSPASLVIIKHSDSGNVELTSAVSSVNNYAIFWNTQVIPGDFLHLYYPGTTVAVTDHRLLILPSYGVTL